MTDTHNEVNKLVLIRQTPISGIVVWGLKAETEGFIMAAQDQNVYTRNYQAIIIKNGVDPKSRMYDHYDETVNHLVSGCPVIGPNEYKNRYDRVVQYIHWKVCQHYKAPYHKNWYKHKPEPVVEADSATILWDFAIHVSIHVTSINKLDIIIKGQKNNSCILVELMLPMDKILFSGGFGKYQNTRTWK